MSIVVAVHAAAVSSFAQDEAKENAATEATSPTNQDAAEPELLERWKFFSTLKIPAAKPDGGSEKYIDLILGPEVFAAAREDLGDLRLIDGAGKPVPYSLRVLHPRDSSETLYATEFNRAEPKDGPIELSFDLKQALDSSDIQHNEVKVESSGHDFRRRVEIEGSDDGKEWRKLAVGNLMRFAYQEQKVERNSFSYPPSRLRYVRVRVHADPQRAAENGDQESFVLQSVHVQRQVRLPGERKISAAEIGQREPTRIYGVPGSAWIIDLGGKNVPCDQLIVDVENAEFARDAALEVEAPFGPLSKPTFSSHYLNDQNQMKRKAGDKREPVSLTFSEVKAQRLRLKVTDFGNPPLVIRGMKFAGAARQVVFERPRGDASSASDLKLYFGNPDAIPPNYDFDRNLPLRLENPPLRIDLAAPEKNPNFTPPPLPFTERFPAAIYVVLAATTVALSLVIASLARAALHNAPAAV